MKVKLVNISQKNQTQKEIETNINKCLEELSKFWINDIVIGYDFALILYSEHR